MKKILLLFLVGLLVASCSPQEEKYYCVEWGGVLERGSLQLYCMDLINDQLLCQTRETIEGNLEVISPDEPILFQELDTFNRADYNYTTNELGCTKRVRYWD